MADETSQAESEAVRSQVGTAGGEVPSSAGAPVPPDPGHPRSKVAWPPEDIRRITDALADGLVVVDPSGRILYVNPAAADFLGWESALLVGEPFSVLVPERSAGWLNHFETLVHGEAPDLVGERLDITVLRRDGREVRVDLVLSVGVDRGGRHMVIGVLRPHDGQQLRRLSRFTQQLLDVLTATSDAPPAEQLLSALGRRLHWDVATLWGLESDGALVCRHVWTRADQPVAAFLAEKRSDPNHGSDGLPRSVVETDKPVWATDLASEERFMTEATSADGLVSACAFPIRHQGQCVGAVKMMSRTRRDPDPDLVELMGAVSGYIGEVLHALEVAAEQDELVQALEETKSRHEFLLRASRVLSEATGYEQTLERLADLAVPEFGDLCLIDVLDGNGLIRRLVSRHADPTKQHLADELRSRYAPDPRGRHPSADVMAGGRSRWSDEMTDGFLRDTSRDERHFSILKELSFTSYMTVPLTVNDQVQGTVTLVSAGSGRRYSIRDLVGAEELAGQIAGAVERARVLDREHHISHTLQHSLLPDRLPYVAGLVCAARYVPGADDADVGGDWYDVISLPEGGAGLVVGDVQGHDMEAASIMGRLRHSLSLLLSEGAPPADALHRLNRFFLASDVDLIATALVAVLDPTPGTLCIASAGHPAPALSGPRETVSLAVPPGPPLGVPGARFAEVCTELRDETLLMFTDGLVERRNRHPDEGTAMLLDAAGSASHHEPGVLVDHVLDRLLTDGDRMDDVAILAVQRTG